MHPFAAFLLGGASVVGALLWRGHRHALREMHTPELDPDLLYEMCPDCEGGGNGCMACWDAGVVPHDC